MLRQAFADFGLAPDVDLDVMTHDQTLASTSARLFAAFDGLLSQEQPDVVLVQGDTTTVMTASLCSFYRNIPVGHVEAGLRSFDRKAPFPEEVNRRIAGIVADLHFCPTEVSKANLLREGIPEQAIHVTGNTVIDALLFMQKEVRAKPRPFPPAVAAALAENRRLVLVTGHRRENFGDGFRDICLAIRQLSQRHPDVRFVYPVHLNPHVQKPVYEILGDSPGIILCPPQPYKDFVQLMDNSCIILSDSGGIQEEAPTLGKPVLVMREVTERPEGVLSGTSILVGTNVEKIVKESDRLLTDAAHYDSIAQIRNPFGDGKACERIAAILKDWINA